MTSTHVYMVETLKLGDTIKLAAVSKERLSSPIDNVPWALWGSIDQRLPCIAAIIMVVQSVLLKL